MSIYSDKLAHIQFVINCRYSVAQLCTREDVLAYISGTPSVDDVMCYSSSQRNNTYFLCFRFEGTLSWEGKQYALDNDNIVLRGAILRNTNWCYGVVIFAGKDTKLMQNSGTTKFKRTSIDRLLNFVILGVSVSGFLVVVLWVFETLSFLCYHVHSPWLSY